MVHKQCLVHSLLGYPSFFPAVGNAQRLTVFLCFYHVKRKNALGYGYGYGYGYGCRLLVLGVSRYYLFHGKW